MVRVEVFRDGSSVIELIELRFVESNRERPNRLRRGFDHQPYDDAGVDTAGEKGAERHVAHHVRAYGVGEDRAQLFRGLLRRSSERLGCGNLPVLDNVGPSGAPAKEMARRELANRFEERAIPWRV